MIGHSGYCPKKEYASYFFGHVSRHLDRIMASSDHILILGDFNATIHDDVMKDFCGLYDLENLIKEPTCNLLPQTSYLLNSKNCFENSIALEIG